MLAASHMGGGARSDKGRWLASCAALAVGASLGWSLADLASSPPGPLREGPESAPSLPVPTPRDPLHPILPKQLAKIACPFEVVEGSPSLEAEEIASGIRAPVSLGSPPKDPRIFVVEREGRIVMVESGKVVDLPFFAQEGLTLGSLTFHPAYRDNGRLFLSVVAPRANAHRILEGRVSQDPDFADDASFFPLLEVPLVQEGDEAAILAFGPDGYLYIGLGDGGELGDPRHHAQRTDTLFGKILRIDVDQADGKTSYTLPEGNWRGPRVRGEIWAIGLRRPRSLSFDREGDLFVVDVGEQGIDEINLVAWDEPRPNLGWSFVEGSLCRTVEGCDREGLHPPLVELRREPDECKIIGGRVYRGCSMPDREGDYFYGDSCGRVDSLTVDESGAPLPLADRAPLLRVPGLVSLGEDAHGELYGASASGRIVRIAPRP